MTGYSAYNGKASQYEVHKFMDLSYAEVTYFITQVALSAQSFGVASDDLVVAGTALNSLFNVRYAPPTTVIPAQGAQLQSICTDETCPLAVNDTMTGYLTNVTEPSSVPASAVGAGASSTASSTATGTKTGSSSTSTSTGGAASAVGFSMMAVFGGVLAFLAFDQSLISINSYHR